MNRLILALTFLAVSLSAQASQSLGGPHCSISEYIDIDYYLGKSYLRLPKKIRDMPRNGSGRFQRSWNVSGPELGSLKLHSADIEEVFFEAYKGKIYALTLIFNHEAILNSRVNPGAIVAWCGVPVDSECTVLEDGRTSIQYQYKNELYIVDNKIESLMMGIPFYKGGGCFRPPSKQ